MVFDCTDLSIFAFQTPYVYKNGRDLLKLETSGIRGAYQRGKRKNEDTSDEEEEGATDDDDQAPETPPDTDESDLTDEKLETTQLRSSESGS